MLFRPKQGQKKKKETRLRAVPIDGIICVICSIYIICINRCHRDIVSSMTHNYCFLECLYYYTE